MSLITAALATGQPLPTVTSMGLVDAGLESGVGILPSPVED